MEQARARTGLLAGRAGGAACLAAVPALHTVRHGRGSRHLRAGVCDGRANHPARGIRLCDARHPAAESRMNAKPTLLIVSYYFAPSPLVGAKRFSFLAREFVRLGYDVHVITNNLWETRLAGRTIRCRSPVRFTAAPRPFEVQLRARHPARARRIPSCAGSRARGLRVTSGRAATRRRWKSRANYRAGSSSPSPPHVGIDRRRASPKSALAADTRLSRSLERTTGPSGIVAGSCSGWAPASSRGS